MKSYNVEATSLIKAPASEVYAIIADYRERHPRILPKPYFISLSVLEGGCGEGTKISFQMKVLGSTLTFVATITEPDPGHVLVETNLGGGEVVTTFVVDPVQEGKYAQVRIHTSGKTEHGGVLGTLERIVTRIFLLRAYKAELVSLAALAEA